MLLTILLILLIIIWFALGVWAYSLQKFKPWIDEDRSIMRAWQYRDAINLIFVFMSGVVIIVLFNYFMIFDFWLALLYSLLGVLVGQLAIQNKKINTYARRITYKLCSKYSKNLGFLKSFLQFLQNNLKRLQSDTPYYSSSAQLRRFLKFHQDQHESLSKKEQNQILHRLAAEDTTIDSLIIPLKKAQMIKSNEKIGTLFLQEIHDSPYGSFVVYEEKRNQPIGILNQSAAMQNAKRHVKVKSIIDERIIYLPRNTSIKKALITFAETSTPLSVIISDNNKPVGVLYAQDIIRELFED